MRPHIESVSFLFSRLIASNAGETGDVVINNVLQGQKEDPDYGWNAATGEYGNMLGMGVIDPTKVPYFIIESRCPNDSLCVCVSTR